MRVRRALAGIVFSALAAVPLLAGPAHAGLRQCIATEFWNGIEAVASCPGVAQDCVAREFWNGLAATLTCA